MYTYISRELITAVYALYTTPRQLATFSSYIKVIYVWLNFKVLCYRSPDLIFLWYSINKDF